MTKKEFDNSSYKWKAGIDYRKNPELYSVGKGEQGVLICEPYKSEILPFWRFATPEQAELSANKIFSLFLEYLKKDDFIGADMARKFLQMGFTRSRRYYNYKGGRKYKEDGDLLERGTGDLKKMHSSNIFYTKWREAEANPLYSLKKKHWRSVYG
jgi:hypothetical protein